LSVSTRIVTVAATAAVYSLAMSQPATADTLGTRSGPLPKAGTVLNAENRTSGKRSRLPSLEERVARTLQINPGSRRIGKASILFEPGIMASLPPDGAASARAARMSTRYRVCASGWLCAWPHADFVGPALGIRYGVQIQYREWAYHEATGRILHCRDRCVFTNGWKWWAFSISSVYNNIPELPLARFYEPGAGHWYAPYSRGPIAWVGDNKDNRFTLATAKPW
jgi:hypothetical protein